MAQGNREFTYASSGGRKLTLSSRVFQPAAGAWHHSKKQATTQRLPLPEELSE